MIERGRGWNSGHDEAGEEFESESRAHSDHHASWLEKTGTGSIGYWKVVPTQGHDHRGIPHVRVLLY